MKWLWVVGLKAGQRKQFEDVTLCSGRLWWEMFTVVVGQNVGRVKRGATRKFWGAKGSWRPFFCSWLTIIDIRPSTVRSNVSQGQCMKWFTKTFVQKMYLQLQKALWLPQSLLLKILLKYEGLHTAADNMMMWVYRQHTQELCHKPRWANWPHNTSHSPSLLLLEHLLVTASRCVQVDYMRG